jgi:hypothetical protein
MKSDIEEYCGHRNGKIKVFLDYPFLHVFLEFEEKEKFFQFLNYVDICDKYRPITIEEWAEVRGVHCKIKYKWWTIIGLKLRFLKLLEKIEK